MKVLAEKRTALRASVENSIRFSEIDVMRIVWHGNYALYFEDAREAFGKKYGLGYFDVLNAGYGAPLVELTISYKQAIVYGMRVRVDIVFINTESAKVIFEYEIRNIEDESLLATGRSVQVFVDANGKLVLMNPAFYVTWKNNHGL